MKNKEIQIYNQTENTSTTIIVEEISNNIFRTIEDEIIDCRLSLGVEFETKINDEGFHEIVKIIKESDFVTYKFLLSSQFKIEEYELLGEEISKIGGFWQIDFGNIATINLPKNSKINIEEIFKTFDFKPTYIA
ncbi:hypothetical protein H1R17_03585 [Flavobacterium sp. xlx-214]|uniref:hypothetical protein n=1 Tax=unclassified Flavobacterium TaxID=196869 RepID=UPI0013D08AE7|nr:MULTISPECIES: hypothetical protein [unclassified Flavobacterium]MBA5791972.1 hypothetical protein [Flavobacterium sp. xlx-221]QMI84226.1 hypothetical protein H1R17_03585 [Flavobacterium sp. xlx-214]